MRIETKCLNKGYEPKNGEPRAMPIYQSTTYTYDSAEHVGNLFDLSVPGHMYSRISNPTVAFVEEKIAALEGGVSCLLTTSGQTASMLSIMNISKSGDHFVCASQLYGGTVNLFNVTLRKFGIDCTFVDADASEEEISALVRENTRCIFGETLANPAISVLDIEKFARVAHKHDIPLLVDNTFPTPVLCRPFEHGADIVIHSTTKYMDGHAVAVGGAIVESGKFNWANGKFPEFTEVDESYHGVIYMKDFAGAPFTTKARVQLTRDIGVCPPAHQAFLLNLGLETLHVRMERHSQNADRVAKYLASRTDKVEFVNYPTLPGDKYHELANKYLPNGCSGVVSFSVKGGREAAMKFMDNLKLANIVVHVADVHTCVLHPASATHRQLTDDQLVAAGITPGLIRYSVGIENAEDLIEDLELAFAAE